MDEVRVRVPDPPLRDEVIALRLLCSVDTLAFVEGLRDPDVFQFAYGGRLRADPADVGEYIARVPGRLEAGEAILLAVTDADGGAFLGKTMLFGIDADERDAELGFWLSPRARGRGVAARAIGLTVSWAFDELGLERVHGLTETDNAAAQRTMEKAGLVREGVLRGLERRPRGRVDFVSYSMLHTDEPSLSQVRGHRES
jgi:ribosomal-protein-alanine N-acetyltransferase